MPSLVNFSLQTPENEAVINLGAHSAKVEVCARASIRLASFAGTCQILVIIVSAVMDVEIHTAKHEQQKCDHVYIHTPYTRAFFSFKR